MESYGDLLRKAREDKNLEIDSISREISIEKHYIIGLENEDNNAFHGEAYLTGFLRNYANFLELDADYLLKLYHNKQLQEAPLPEGLLVKPKRTFSILAVVIPLVLVLGFITTLLILIGKQKK